EGTLRRLSVRARAARARAPGRASRSRRRSASLRHREARAQAVSLAPSTSVAGFRGDTNLRAGLTVLEVHPQPDGWPFGPPRVVILPSLRAVATQRCARVTDVAHLTRGHAGERKAETRSERETMAPDAEVDAKYDAWNPIEREVTA